MYMYITPVLNTTRVVNSQFRTINLHLQALNPKPLARREQGSAPPLLAAGLPPDISSRFWGGELTF